jgi:excisionase family DNA binding protein
MTSAAALRRPERVRASEAASILGIEVRTVQALAARGELPGAAKVGKLWTFDEAALRLWIRERSAWPKNERHQSTPIGEAIRYGRDLPLQVANSVKASEQALRKLRQNGSQR